MAENTHLTLDGANQPIIENGTTAPLNDLMAQATARYAIKDYNAAAELYSRATELQAEINGEMSPHNADLLYAYGRCLYHVAVSNSDVLGSKVAGENRDSGEKKAKRRKVDASSPSNVAEKREEKIIEEGVKHVSEGSERPKAKEEIQKTEPKPYFQFTGDENFDESDEEDEDDAVDGEGQEEAEEDDFSNAYEVLDLARVLLQRRLEEAESTNGKGKMQGDPEPVSQLKERLADTYDLQAEISLEGERFPNAVTDLKAALEIKQHLFPQYSSLLAEAHYKLSLALEFSSVTQQKDENLDTEAGKNDVVDEAMREEAAKEMEEAIQSCKVRIRREEELLALGTTVNGDSIRMKVTRESIDDVKEIVKDMEHRVRIIQHLLRPSCYYANDFPAPRTPPTSRFDK